MISVVTLTKNSARTLKRTLESIKNFSEVILIDTGSTDHTLEIASQGKNVKIHKETFTSFGKLRNLGAAKAKNPWILQLDSDESLSTELIKEIQSLSLQEDQAYSLPFHNYFKGKHMKCCGWHPEFHVRLYPKNKTCFIHEHLHETLNTSSLKVEKLKNPVIHTPYLTMEDFLHKMQLYSSLFAKEHLHKKTSSFSKALLHGSFAFFKSYFLKKGIFFGSRGFILSSYQASCAFYKYLKLAELSKK